MNSYSYTYPNTKATIGFGKACVTDALPNRTTALPKAPQLAMAYVPFQTELEVYDDAKALKAGTLFPCLDKPFLGSGLR